MTESFHNPYHFVPLSGEIPSLDGPEGEKNRQNIGNVADHRPLTAENMGHAAFDRYHRGTFSGRLICRLITRSPAVFGGKQEPGKTGKSSEPGKVHSFKLNGKPAVPGSTVRGCISSVAEAASNSALRVLDDTYYSRRGDFKNDALSAIGMVVFCEGEFKLMPLTHPNVNFDRPDDHKRFSDAMPEENFKAYCFSKRELYTLSLKTGTRKKPKYYWAKLRGGFKRSRHNRSLVLGKEVDGPLKDKPAPGYIRGILRVLSTPARLKEMPTKKHEIFIPFPEEMEKNPENLLEIGDGVLERFQKIAENIGQQDNKRRKAKKQDPLPYCLVGTQTFESRRPPYSLADGDIVFFDIQDGKVSKVSVSQIWREDFRDATDGAATAHTFFRKMNPELLPFNPERKTLTPAEMLFGCVEERPSKDKNIKKDDTKLRALASRLRFSNAALVDHPGESAFCSEKWTTLRILASPKPPSPALYFRKKNIGNGQKSPKNIQSEDCHIFKKQLSPAAHQPQGRKFYLHHKDKNNYETKVPVRGDTSLGQKNQVRPLKEDCSFLFTVDFENLSPAELGLLAYSLGPCRNFRYKMGMGKPLGLGSVEIEIAGVMMIDRLSRYSSVHLKTGSRYAVRWVKNRECLEWIRRHNPADGAAFDEEPGGDENPLTPHVEKFLKQTEGCAGIRRCLETLGSKVCTNVTYPLMQNQNPEEKLFKWFVKNEDDRNKERQGLIPVDASHQKNWLPRLKSWGR